MTPGTLCLISGMAGSKQGWREAPYCACPAGFDAIAAQLEWVEPGRIAIVPGLSIDRSGVPDVMRGEETQIFGALQLLGLDNARLVLPGTHSKWVTVAEPQGDGFFDLDDRRVLCAAAPALPPRAHDARGRYPRRMPPPSTRAWPMR
jgi:2-keto-3-deoxy-galactonokinase